MRRVANAALAVAGETIVAVGPVEEVMAPFERSMRALCRLMPVAKW